MDPVSSTVEIIDQKVLFTDKNKKRDLLLWALQDRTVTSALVFSRTKHLADRLAKFLKKNGVSADSIHGDKSQGARLRALGDFKSGKCRVLVATDIAARGIDVSGISHVFNFDLPDVPETYVHRIGRTGRAGHDGAAVSFCTAEEVDALRSIEKLIGKRVAVVEEHPFPCSQPIPEPLQNTPKKKEKKPKKANQNLQNALQNVERAVEKQEKKTQKKNKSTEKPTQNEKKQSETKPKFKEIDLDLFRDEDRTVLPLPSGGFSSEVRLPGWVAARSGSSAKKEKAAPAKQQKQPLKTPVAAEQQPAGKTEQKKKQRHKLAEKAAGNEQKQQKSKKTSPKETFLQPEGELPEVRSSSRGRRSREPKWIPVNNQPIVTRPQSYFIEPAEPQVKQEQAAKKKKQHRKPRKKNKTPEVSP